MTEDVTLLGWLGVRSRRTGESAQLPQNCPTDMDLASSTSKHDSAHEIHMFRDPFSDADTDTDTIIDYSDLPPRTPAYGPSDVFVVKALPAASAASAAGAAGANAGRGGMVKYRVYCDPDATLAVLRDTLQNDEDKIMCADDRFHQGDFRVGKSAERISSGGIFCRYG
jgi:hypothetical protein